MTEPEAWLLGPIDGVSKRLMPVAHSLVQARKELAALHREVADDERRSAPGGAASIGFHVAHIGGSLDRLFTYARGESLSPEQLDQMAAEGDAGRERSGDELFATTLARLDACLESLRHIPDDGLLEPRAVGRRQLPATVIGLLFHAAEHTTMHVGQIRTTLKIIRGRS